MSGKKIKIAFLQDLFYDHLGTLGLVGALKAAGHSARVIIADRRFAARIDEYDPDLFAFSVTTGVHRWALSVVEGLKEKYPDRPTIFGGPHPTHFPELIEQPGVDYICRGEGEGAIVDLADRLAAGDRGSDVANLWVKTDAGIIKNELRPLIDDLDQLPFVDRTYYDDYPMLARSRFRLFISGRGCPFRCRHCHNRSFQELYRGKGKIYRKRSVENVCDEIAEVKNRYGLHSIDFADDIFSLDRDWVAKFSEVYPKRVGLPFCCNYRADNVDEPTAANLKKAGCHAVLIGLESGSDRLRNDLLNKRVTREALIKCAEIFHRQGIKIQTTNMLGLPGETLEEGFETVKLNRIMKADLPWCSVLQPYPRTELAAGLIAAGDISADPDDFSYTFFKGSPLKQPDIDRLVNLHKFFYYLVRFPFVEPLVRLLIKAPPNRIFELVFATSFFLHYKRKSRLGLGVIAMQGANLAARLIFDRARSPVECITEEKPDNK